MARPKVKPFPDQYEPVFNVTNTMDVTDLIGKNGRYQYLVLVFCSIRGIMLAFNNLGSSFIVPDVDHWCQKPDGLVNLTDSEWKAVAIPKDASGEYDRCHMYQMNFSKGGPFTVNRKVQIKCTEWDYDHFEFHYTATEKWNLVCENKFQRSLPQTVYMAGMIPAAALTGGLCDRFGRRRVVLGSVIAFVVLELSAAFVPYFWLFCVFRFFIAWTIAGVDNSMTLYMEVVGPEVRDQTMIPYALFWAIGNMVVALVAFLCPDWSYQLYFGACFYTIGVLFWRVFYESPRWLLTKGKYSRAREVIRNIVRLNGRKIVDETTFAKLEDVYKKKTEVNRPNLGDLFGTKTISIYTITNFVFQMMYGFVYYEVCLSTSTFPVNSYLNFVIGGGIEILAAVSSYIVARWCPRYISSYVLTAVSAAAFFSLIFVPRENVWAISVLQFVCRLCIATLINFNLVYRNEMFPTSVRAVAIGSSETVYRIGAAMQPIISQTVTSAGMRSLNTGALLIALLMIIPWPETKDKVLPDVVSELQLRNLALLSYSKKVHQPGERRNFH